MPMIAPAPSETHVGIVGHAASGKDTVAAILQAKYGFIHISLGDWLRADLRRQGVTPSRGIQSETADRYRRQISPGFIIDQALSEYEAGEGAGVVLSGVYSPSEGDYIKNVLTGTILGVTTGDEDDPMRRYQRLVARSDGSRDKLSEDEFRAAHDRESTGDYMSTNIPVLLEMADYLIRNMSDQAYLESQVDSFVEELGTA